MGDKRNRLFEMAEEGLLDPLTLARDLLGWLSEDECDEFARANDIGLGNDE